jgi:HAE1 family hydrophobic/amphiphilic exporter-1
MNPVTISIQRPVATTMLVAFLIVLGMFSYSRINLDMLPKVDIPIVTVLTVYPGADPQNMETLVSKRIEDAVSTVNGIKSIRSDSVDGLSNVIIEFEDDIDVDVVAADVREKVSAIRNKLPADAKEPIILKLDINALPIMSLGITGERNAERLYMIAKDVIKDDLQQVEGVADIDFIGSREREIALTIKPSVLKEYGMSPFTLAGMISQKNLNLPSGYITRERDEISVRMQGEFSSIREIEELEIPMPGGKTLKLTELATVRDTFEEYRQGVLLNGRPSVAMIIKKRSDANTVLVAAKVRQALSLLEKKLPGDIKVTIVRDRSQFIVDSVNDLNGNLLIGVGITIFVLYLFLHSLKLTLIAGLSIPVSIVASYTLIYLFGFSLNMMTLMALAISVGILVSNAIVVIENIAIFLQKAHKLKEERKSGKDLTVVSGESAPAGHQRAGEFETFGALSRAGDAAEHGTKEVLLAVTGATLTNVVVFVPIAFMEGMIGRFFYEFGLTVTFATFISLLTSFTMVPMLAARFLTERDIDPSRHGWFARLWDSAYIRLAHDYGRMISWCLHHRIATVTIGVAFTGACLLLAPYIGFEFVTEPDQGEFDITIELPPGTSLTSTASSLRLIETILKEYPEVATVFTKVGKTESLVGGANQGTHLGEVSVKLYPKSRFPVKTTDFINRLTPALAKIPDIKVNARAAGIMGTSESPLQIDITGDDPDELKKLAQQVYDIVRQTPGTGDIISSDKAGKPEFRVKPIRAHLARYGLTETHLAMALRSSFEGMVMSTFREKDDDYDIRVRLTEDFRNDLTSLQRLTIVSPQGVSIPLPHLAEIEETLGPVQIKRKYRNKWINISANVVGRSLGEVVRDIQQKTDRLNVPLGFGITFAGAVERMTSAFANLATAGLLAIIFTYILLAALLESFIHPLTILISFPMAFGGIFLGLFLSGQTLSIFSLMAVVMLVGIVVNNGILLIERYRLLLSEGKPLLEAVVEGSPLELRPIIMTTISATAAMIPQAMALGQGGEMRAAMGTVSIGGMLVSAVLSIFIIPIVYLSVEQLKERFSTTAPAAASKP